MKRWIEVDGEVFHAECRRSPSPGSRDFWICTYPCPLYGAPDHETSTYRPLGRVYARRAGAIRIPRLRVDRQIAELRLRLRERRKLRRTLG